MRRLMLKTRDGARNSLARAIRDFDTDPEADVKRFRALIHGFVVLLAYDRTASAEELIADAGGHPLAGLTYVLRPLAEKPKTDDDIC